ncbi:MAG: zinc ribbon domain-containing protein [Clostridiaceae bacterium]
MKNKISNERKALYYVGMGLMIIGVILFLSTFVVAFTGDPFEMMASGRNPMANSIIGFIMIFIGSIIMNIGARGAAGSGLILDPDKAREDLNPYASAAGRLLNDALDEVDVLKKGGSGEDAEEVIRIRCRECGELNEEDARFCKNCGKTI